MKDRVRNALLVPAAFLLALVAAWAPPQHSKAARVVAGHATPTPSAADWKEIDRLVEQQKLAEASAKADAILQRAIRAKNEDEWTRALVRCVRTVQAPLLTNRRHLSTTDVAECAGGIIEGATGFTG